MKKMSKSNASVIMPKKKAKITMNDESCNSDNRNAKKDTTSRNCTVQTDIMDCLKEEVEIISISDDDDSRVVQEISYLNIRICCSNAVDTNEGATAHVSIYDSLYESTSTDVKKIMHGLLRNLLGKFKTVLIT